MKNIIIGAVILAVLLAGYFFLGSKGKEPNLVSAPALVPAASPVISGEFLSLLLNVKNIKLDDSIFSNPAFSSLSDSSITLTPDGTEGRPNPFAPFGAEAKN